MKKKISILLLIAVSALSLTSCFVRVREHQEYRHRGHRHHFVEAEHGSVRPMPHEEHRDGDHHGEEHHDR